ncbi:MAG: fused MFS/spermidine synthase [Candidatus Moraniibacteriota bacterium]
MTITSSRVIQWIGIILIATVIGGGVYQYFNARAAVKFNASQTTLNTNGLVGHWTLDGADTVWTSSTAGTATDISGQSNTGTLTNMNRDTSPVVGKVGQALSFNGSDSYVLVPTENGFSTKTTGSLSAWFTVVNPSATQYLWRSGQTSGNTPSVYSSGGILYYHNIGQEVTLVATAGLVGQWHHLIVTWTAGERTAYLDGTSIGAGEVPSDWGTGFHFGADNDHTSAWNGSIDEVRLYDRSLSAEEAADLYTLGTATINASQNTLNTSGLVGQWSFDGKDINWASSITGTAADTSGQGNTGTLTNMSQSASPVVGKIGQALNFDGTNDYVNAGAPSVLNSLGDYTISAWIKTSSAANYLVVASKWNQSSSGYMLMIDSLGKPEFWSEGLPSSTNYTITGSTAVNDGKWHYIVGKRDGATIYLYVDGASAATPVAASTETITTTTPQLIGAYWNGAGTPSVWFFSGTIDDVRIYSRALSAVEIQSLYALGDADKVNSSVSQSQGTGRLDSGLAGYWKLDENTGSTAADSSTNGFTAGTISGASWTTGQIGSALNFGAATTDVVDLGIANMTNRSQFTLSAWIDPTTLVNSTGYCIASNRTAGNLGFSWSIKNATGFDPNITAAMDFTIQGVASYATSTTPVTKNAWQHVVMVFGNSQVKFYRNGVLIETMATGSMTTGTNLLLGNCGPAGSTTPFKGMIDEFRIYDRMLSANEVTTLYLLTTPTGVDTSLKGYWSFNGADVSGTTAYDRSGAGNNGALTNGPAAAIGKLGQALNFDGTNDYVSVPNASSLNPTNVTVAAWVKTSTTDGYIIAKDPPAEKDALTVSEQPVGTLWQYFAINNIADYITAHKNTLLLSVFLLSLFSLGMYKTKEKEISVHLIICAMAFSGGAALIYEVAATQALTYFFNSSSYSIATAIVSFLLGLALGSFILSRYLQRITKPLRTLVILQGAAGLYALLILPQYGFIASALSSLSALSAGSVALILIIKFFMGIIFLLFPTIMLGASFPLASSLVIKDMKTAGSDVGRLYSWDLIGAILGALIAGFVLLPIFGLTMAFVFGASMNLIAGLLVSSPSGKKMWLVLLSAAVLIPLIAFVIQSRATPDWVQDESGAPVRQQGNGVLFQENSPHGEVMVTKENDYTTLFIDKMPQCGIDYPLATRNLGILVNQLPKNQQALDIGLGCGYSSRLIGGSANIAHVNVVEINPTISKVIKYFNNESVLDNQKVTIVHDDIMHYLARYPEQYDFINVDMSHAGAGSVAPFYTLEYFQLLKAHVAAGGTMRVWAGYGNYEFVRSFYQTVRQAFPQVIVKAGTDFKDDYFSNIEFYVGAENVLLQTEAEKTLQAKLSKEPARFISTLDNQMISRIWQAWGRPYYEDYFGAQSTQLAQDKPRIKDNYLFPLDVKPGDTMQAGVRIIDANGVDSVRISFPHEKGTDRLEMRLTKGTMYDGFWSAQWEAHDTLDKEYITTVIAQNAQGMQSQAQMRWTDVSGCTPSSPTVSLGSVAYAAAIGGTFNVTATATGFSGACALRIQDDTSGSYTTVPNTDTDLDCNGVSCSTTTTTNATKTLRCQAAGTYNIRADESNLAHSAVSTVSCLSLTDMPYGMSTVGGGQFVIISGSTVYTVTSSTSITDNQWHHVVGTYDGTTMRIYVDGTQTGSGTSFSGDLPTSKTGALRIGADYYPTPANFFTGSIDDARLYNRALSAEEVATLYNSGR